MGTVSFSRQVAAAAGGRRWPRGGRAVVAQWSRSGRAVVGWGRRGRWWPRPGSGVGALWHRAGRAARSGQEVLEQPGPADGGHALGMELDALHREQPVAQAHHAVVLAGPGGD